MTYSEAVNNWVLLVAKPLMGLLCPWTSPRGASESVCQRRSSPPLHPLRSTGEPGTTPRALTQSVWALTDCWVTTQPAVKPRLYRLHGSPNRDIVSPGQAICWPCPTSLCNNLWSCYIRRLCERLETPRCPGGRGQKYSWSRRCPEHLRSPRTSGRAERLSEDRSDNEGCNGEIQKMWVHPLEGHSVP